MIRLHHCVCTLSLALAVGGCGSKRTSIDTRRELDTTPRETKDAAPETREDDDGGAGENNPHETNTTDASANPPLVPAGSLVYASAYSRYDLRLLPPGGEPIVLTPDRGREWPAFEGQPRVFGISPDERWVLTCMKGAGLFAVATDASTAGKPLLLTKECGFAHFSADGKELLIVEESRRRLSHLHFDPGAYETGAPDPAVVVTDTGTLSSIGSVQLAGDGWVYTVNDPGGNILLFVVSKGADEPRQVIPQFDAPLYTLELGLDDGRAVLRAEGVTYVVSLEDGAAFPIAPPLDNGLNLAALVDDGQRFIAAAWQDQTHAELWSLRVDGSDLANPVVLLDTYVNAPLFLPNTRRVVARTDEGLVDVAWDGEEAPRFFDTTKDITPEGMSQDEQWVYGCYADELQRLDLHAEAPEWVPVDGALAGFMQPLLATHATLKVHANRYWSCGETILPRAGGQSLSGTIATGRLDVVGTPLAADALHLRMPDGASRQLSADYDVMINKAYLPQGADRVLYGMQSARLNGADQAADVPFHEGSPLEFALAVNDVPVYLRPTDTSGLKDVVVPGYRPGETGVRVLGPGVFGSDPLVVVGDSLLLIHDDGVWLTPIDGTAPTLLLDRAPPPHERDEDGFFPTVLVDERRAQAIAASEGKLLAFSLDGSEAQNPRVVLNELPPQYHWPRAILGDEVLFYTYNERGPCNACIGVTTGEAWVVPLDGSATTAREVAPLPLFIERPRDRGEVLGGPFISQDNKWALAASGEEQFKLVPLPIGSGQELLIEGPRPAHPRLRAPGADFVVVRVDDRLWRVPLSPNDDNRAEATPLTPETSVSLDFEAFYWLDDTEALLFNLPLDGFDATVRVSTRGANAEAWNIMAGGQPGNESHLAALSPDRTWFVFNRGEPSRGLMGARFGEAPFALTQDQDTNERFIGWVR